MKRPLKWEVPVSDTDVLIGAGPVVSVQMQGDVPCVWTLEDVAPDDSPVPRTRLVHWAGTGHPTVEDHGVPLGSIQMHDGHLVFHLFDVTPQVG